MTTVDAETGERGFIITGENSYLEPYEGSTFVVSLPASTLPEAAIAETPLTSA